MNRLTDVVKNLLIINVVLFIGTQAILGEATHDVFLHLVNNPDSANFMEWKRSILALFYPTSEYFRPYQIVSHMFMHADLTHIFFNMFGLFMFGPVLENYMGPKKFLIFYFATGFGAVILYMAMQWLEMAHLGGSPYLANIPVLGASGAIYGILAGFATLFPDRELMLIFPPIPMKAKYMMIGLVVIAIVAGVGKLGPGIAHFAHLGGAIFGFLMIRYWQKNGTLRR